MGAHFDSIADAYHDRAAGTQQAVYDDISRWFSPLVAGKRVLDVGNGGKFSYDVTLPAAVTAIDVSAKMLEKIVDPRIVKIVGNALDLKEVESASIDVVVLGLMLHHVAGKSRSETLRMLRSVLSAARRVLRPGGSLLVTETLVNPFLSALERLLYPASYAFFAPRVGMLYFFSRAELLAAFDDVFGPVQIESRPHGISGWIDPCPGTFPGILKIPAWSLPLRFRSFLLELP